MYSIRLKIDNGILRIEHVGGHVPEGSFQITGDDSGGVHGVHGGGDITHIEIEQRDPLGRFVNRAEHSHNRRDISVPYVQTYHSPTLPGRSRSISDFRGEPHYGEREYGSSDPYAERYPGQHAREQVDPSNYAFGGIPRNSPEQYQQPLPLPQDIPELSHVEIPTIEDHTQAARTGRSPIDIMRERIGADAVPTDGDFERAHLEATDGQPDMSDVDDGLPVPMPQVGPGLRPQAEEVMDEPPRATGSDGTSPSGPAEG